VRIRQQDTLNSLHAVNLELGNLLRGKIAHARRFQVPQVCLIDAMNLEIDQIAGGEAVAQVPSLPKEFGIDAVDLHLHQVGGLRLQAVDIQIAHVIDADPVNFQFHDLRGGEIVPGVRVITTPGHTPGHQVLKLKLRKSGTVILSGDLYHLRANRLLKRVPVYNTERADTLASMGRIETILKNTHGRLIVQHDPKDFQVLPKPPGYLD